MLAAKEKAKTEVIKEQQRQQSQQSKQDLKITTTANVKKIDEVKQEVLNNFNKYDEKDFQVEGFTKKYIIKKVYQF